MLIGELFETRVAEKIEPVIKVSETADEHKLAGEVGSYVVTPSIEKYLAGFLDHYTDTFQVDTTEIGIWISGYFGSGKSHLAKVMGLLAENRPLLGATACARFDARLPPDTEDAKTIRRALARMPQCDTKLLAFNINSLADSRATPLPKLLLSQFYQSKGYGSNLLYARVIESELDRLGRLADLHAAVEKSSGRTWGEIQKNPTFYQRHLYAAASQLAPESFDAPERVEAALKNAQTGEIYNVGFLVDTMLADLAARERTTRRKQRLMIVLDESGQWIEGDKDRLAQLQSLIEEAAIKGQGRLWIVVTTHGDMGSVLKEAKALEADMKKIEGRFRYKFSLTTENIELVLEDRLFKKTLPGRHALEAIYRQRGGVLRDVGELHGARQKLPPCTAEKFATYYPFVPYQVSLVPEIVKSLRSRGGRGEQLSGSTRTLLAITQDILRSGRRRYLDEAVGPLISFDEVYGNLAGEGEVSPDVRDELGRVLRNVPGATALTQHVAEVLYLVRELPYLTRTKENLARLLARDVEDDVAALVERVEPELQRLQAARMVGVVGDEYEFLTGEKRTFEEEVANVQRDLRVQDKERGLAEHFFHQAGRAWWPDWLGFQAVAYAGVEFPFKVAIDGFTVPGRQGDVTLRITTPAGRETLASIEDRSLRSDEQNSVFLFSAAVPRFEEHLARYLAMKDVIDTWKGDTHRSEEAKALAQARERDDLPRVRARVVDDLRDGLSKAQIVFRGASRAVSVPATKKAGEVIRAEVGSLLGAVYPKLEKMPVRVSNEEAAIRDVLAGGTGHRDVVSLHLFDASGKLDPSSIVVDAVRVYLAGQQARSRRVLGADLLAEFSAPPYGWDPNAVRVGVAALVRAAAVKVVVNKKPLTNPADPELVDALRVGRAFDKVELVLEETEVDPDELAAVRTLLKRLAKKRDIDETPAALAEVAGVVAGNVGAKADRVRVWAAPANLPLPPEFDAATEGWVKIAALTNPVHRVHEVFLDAAKLEQGHSVVGAVATFQESEGSKFVEMTRLVREVVAIEHLVDESNPVRTFHTAFEHTRTSRSITEKETWRHLRSLEGSARMELGVLLDRWRAEARALGEHAIRDATERALPLDVPEDAIAPLTAPLRALLDGLESVEGAARIGALPQRVRQLAERLAQAVLEEAARRRRPPEPPQPPKPPDGPPEPPPKPRGKRTVRVGDVVGSTVIGDVGTWEVVRDELDRTVQALLDQNVDVVIT